jgi:hypothetical protein
MTTEDPHPEHPIVYPGLPAEAPTPEEIAQAQAAHEQQISDATVQAEADLKAAEEAAQTKAAEESQAVKAANIAAMQALEALYAGNPMAGKPIPYVDPRS